jgi:hypothetical protein
MLQRQLLHFGEIVAMNAYLSPDKVGARGLNHRSRLGPMILLPFSTRPAQRASPRGPFAPVVAWSF